MSISVITAGGMVVGDGVSGGLVEVGGGGVADGREIVAVGDGIVGTGCDAQAAVTSKIPHMIGKTVVCFMMWPSFLRWNAIACGPSVYTETTARYRETKPAVLQGKVSLLLDCARVDIGAM